MEVKNQYDIERERLFRINEECGNSQAIQRTLDKKLVNDGSETDYDAWLEGSKKFAKDNEDVLKAMLK